jgi:transcription elongation factor/antiterminator RfaH
MANTSTTTMAKVALLPLVEVEMQSPFPNELAPGARWFLVHTRPNSERKAELNLKAQGLKTFLPQIEKTIRHARRLATVRRPLFARYLFVSLDIGRERWSSINSTVGVSRLVAQEGRPVPVPFGIVETLRAHSDAGLTRLDHSLVQGQRVRILSGPLADFTATVMRLDARRRVDVLLEIMGGAVSASVDRRALAPAA